MSLTSELDGLPDCFEVLGVLPEPDHRPGPGDHQDRRNHLPADVLSDRRQHHVHTR